jgi:hypothetical protein
MWLLATSMPVCQVCLCGISMTKTIIEIADRVSPPDRFPFPASLYKSITIDINEKKNLMPPGGETR